MSAPLMPQSGPLNPIPSYFEIPNRRVDGFVGREEELQGIDKALSDGSSPRYAVLQGMGGQGKSQMALEYCHRKRNNPYSAIFWVDATTESSVKGSFEFISECIKAETDYLSNIEARVAFVLRIFTSWTVQWLMVFDNYDNPNTFLNIRDFFPQSERGAILVTSRHPDSNALVMNQSNHFFELSGLDKSAAVTLLIQQSQTNEFIFEDAIKIVVRLGYHPLAITQASAYIRKRKLPLCEFMGHYKRRKKIILETTPQLSHYRKTLGNAEEETSLNVFTTWELSFRQLQSELFQKDVETKLLTLLAFFDEKDISEELFAGFCAYHEHISDSANLLIWLNAFSNVESQWNSNLFEDALIRLRDSSLLQAFARRLDGFYHASLHPLVKDWIHLRMDNPTCQENTCMAETLVADFLRNSWQKQHFYLPLLTKQNIKSHIIALEESYQEFFISRPDIPSNQRIFDNCMTSQFWFAQFLRETGSYHLSEILYQRLNAQNQKVFGLEHPSTLTSMADLASTYSYQGRWKEAEELGVQVMETSSRVLGLEHLDTLSSMSNLASTFRNQGRWKEAEELGLQVMEMRKAVLGSEHPDTLTSIAHLASTYQNQARWKEAEELGLQAMGLRKAVLGSEHPDTLTSIAHLASTYRNTARSKEAEGLEVQVTKMRKKALGLEHLDMDPKSALPQPPLMQNPSSYGGSTLVDSANLIQIERLAKEQQELELVSNNTQDIWQSTENTQNQELDEIKSLVSDDEDISSQVSIMASSQRAIAERQLAALMAHHPELGIAYDEAMALMPEDRFVANFRRLLKRFYLDIRQIASTGLERTAVELMRSRGARMRLARIISDTRNVTTEEIDAQTEENIRIAHQRDRTETERWTKSIAHGSYEHQRDRTETEQNSKEEWEPDEAENTATESSSSDSESDEKGEFPNIQLVEDFLTGSDAFRALSHNFGIFVLPRSLSQLALSIPPNQIRFSNYNDVSLPNKIKTFMEEHTGAQWNWYPLSPKKQLLGSNETRMHWQCFCGKHLWTEMSTSQSKIFQKLSKSSIARSSQIPLCSKVQKRGFLTSVAQWMTYPNSASSNTQQSTPSGMSTSPSALIGPATTGPGPITRPTPSASSSPNIVANNPHTIASSNFRHNNRLWTLFGVHGGRKTLELGQICSDNSGKGFVRKLRETYRNLRGFRRVWFSFWQFSHCDFVKFEKIGKNRIISRCSDLPTGPDYEYFPRPPQADNPPITPHEFNLAFSSCGKYCLFAPFHDCFVLEDEQDFALRIARRKGKFEVENSIRRDPVRFAWGIQAQYTISFLHVLTYHILMMVGPTVFWVWWQKHHPNDLQNASIPLTVAAVLISLFWSATGILRGFREPRET